MKELDISYLDTLIGTLADDLDAKFLTELTDENFTVAMFRAGFLTPITDENGVITGFDFQPPQNFDMLMTGTDGTDVLTAGDGDDIIISRGGDDTIDAGAGNDTIDAGAGDDIIDGGAGTDTLLIEGNAADFTYDFIDDSSLTISDALWGTDTISNVEIFNFLDGSYTRAELESLFSGPNEITGTSGNDTLYGTSGDDIMYGGDGIDTLYGEGGNDTLYGGNGIDFLYGGTGADTFVFTASDAFTGVERIGDFSVTEGDAIDISDVLIGYDANTSAITDFVQITDNGTNSTIAVDVDGGGDNFVTMAIALNTIGLTDEQALLDGGNLIV